MTMLALLLSLSAISVYAADIEGIMLSHRTGFGFSNGVLVEPGPFEETLQACAAAVAAQRVAKFEIAAIAPWQPGMDESEDNADYVCWTQTRDADQNPYYIMNTTSSFECYSEDCDASEDFENLPPGVYRRYLRANQNQVVPGAFEKEISLPMDGFATAEECKNAAVRYNRQREEGQAAIRYGSVGHHTGMMGSTVPVPYCLGYVERTWNTYRRSSTHLVLLSPPYARSVQQFLFDPSPANRYPKDVTCSQKDIPVLLSPTCQQFTYSTDLQGHANINQVRPEDLQISDSFRAVVHTSRQTFALTYRKIAQTSHLTFSQSSTRQYGMHSETISAFSTNDALEKCSQIALNSMYHTFNLVLSRKGWKCTYAFKYLTEVALLDSSDHNVLQSYMFAANYTSQNDLEA